jgi:hypothetical protein
VAVRRRDARDWDGDGAVDLIVMLVDPGTGTPAGLELLRNIGGGSFESKGIVAGATGLLAGGTELYPRTTRDSLAKDLDGDGDLDLVLRTRSDNLGGGFQKWSCWLRNDGAAGFAFVEEFPNIALLDAADIDGDGIVDLFGVQASGSPPWAERWAAGLGGGAWAPWIVIPGTSVRPCNPADEVQITDVDGDGDLDLVHTWHRSDASGLSLSGRVHLNDGAGTFTQDPTVDVRLKPGLLEGRCGARRRLELRQPRRPRVRDDGHEPGGDPHAEGRQQRLGGSDRASRLRGSDAGALPPGAGSRRRSRQRRDHELPRPEPHVRGRAGRRASPDRTGQPGEGGLVPVLGASGPFRVGQTARLRLRGGKPGTTGELVVSSASSLPATMAGQGRIDATATSPATCR